MLSVPGMQRQVHVVIGLIGLVFNFFPIVDNYIDGAEFNSLTESEIREIIPPIGLAKKIIRMIPKVGLCPCVKDGRSCSLMIHTEFHLGGSFYLTTAYWCGNN